MRPGPFSAETRAAWWTLPKSPVTSAASAPPDDSARCRCCRTSWACRPTPKRRDFPFRPTSKRREFARSIYLEKEASNSFGFIAEGGDAAQQRGGVMAVGTRGSASNYLQRAPSPSGLADVLDVILDKGLVIDAYVRVSVIGIELLTIDARIVIASVDTYLRFAEAVNRLDLKETEAAGIEELRGGGSEQKTKGVLEGAKEKLTPGGSDSKKERAR